MRFDQNLISHILGRCNLNTVAARFFLSKSKRNIQIFPISIRKTKFFSLFLQDFLRKLLRLLIP